MSDEPMLTPEEEAEMVARINANPYLQPNPQPDEIERVARAIVPMLQRAVDEVEPIPSAVDIATAAIAAMDTGLREQIAAKDGMLIVCQRRIRALHDASPGHFTNAETVEKWCREIDAALTNTTEGGE